ncbi:hypothetical protein O6H91_02G078200 [Diphasiastrum complanatum]|uniref:Uncharacterized protein n=1 Tax=Diphasiastrum complanatum TaxID=34168 RepID=A0ACC2EH77_DIPCM|nr:hypothetical protein O6H91_02G078200 [Diphasiastrum complanatum]
MCRLNSCDCPEDSDTLQLSRSPPQMPRIVATLPVPEATSCQAIENELFDSESDELKRWPTSSEVIEELKQIGSIACPMVIMGLLLYARAMISMLFLGRLGELELAGGSLAIGFANITGYSVLAGLSMGMEPICGQGFGAKRWDLMGLTLQRTILFLICACLPIGFLWVNMKRILLWCGQDKNITQMASTYLIFSLPDLLAQAILNPLRIYLRTQKVTLPLTCCAAVALLVHVPINLFLVHYVGMGIRGVALGASWTNFNYVFLLIGYLRFSVIYNNSWAGWSSECLKDWKPLLNLAIPSCLSVCLEWWWYELMIIFSGLLGNAQAAVATMGILIQTTALVYVFPSSLSLAVSTRVGNELGANRPEKARIAMLVALGCASVLGVIAMTFTTTMRHAWGSMFTSDEAILSLTALALPVVGLCEIGNCPQTTGCGVLRGSARPSTGANINLGSFYFVGLPVALLLGFLFNVGFVGLWFGLLAAQGACVVLILIIMMRTDWAHQAARAKLLTAYTRAEKIADLRSGCLQDQSETKEILEYGFDGKDEQQMALISIKVIHSLPNSNRRSSCGLNNVRETGVDELTIKAPIPLAFSNSHLKNSDYS